VTFEFTAHRWFLQQLGLSNPFASAPISVSLSAVAEEGAIAVFDNIRLCERSNQCNAVYPTCTVATLDYTLMIDYSGSMVALRDDYDAHMESRLQAVRTIEALLSSWTGGGDNLGVVRVAAFAFHNGPANHFINCALFCLLFGSGALPDRAIAPCGGLRCDPTASLKW
jgi:hypothetical protein